jgi:hypothetical protein
MESLTVDEKLLEMVKVLAELGRKLNIEQEHDAALAVQQALVAVNACRDAASAFSELEWDWEPIPDDPAPAREE